jgi:superfamily II DNA or RNA helicase
MNVDSIKIGDKTKYDIVIIDEFHHSAAKTYRKLNEKNWSNIYYRFGLTATPFRSKDTERLLLESVLSKVIYEVPYEVCVQKGYIVPLEVFYVSLHSRKIKGNQNSWPAMYKELVTNCEPRNTIIQELLLKFHANKVPTICLVKEISHGESLSCDGAFNFVSGQNDERHLIDDFCEGKINTLIGTEGVLGEGIDTKPAEVIIIAGLGKSKNRLMQSIGRGFRRYPGKESCKVIIFKDSSHKWAINHFKEQCKVIKEQYGVIPVEIKVDNQ